MFGHLRNMRSIYFLLLASFSQLLVLRDSTQHTNMLLQGKCKEKDQFMPRSVLVLRALMGNAQRVLDTLWKTPVYIMGWDLYSTKDRKSQEPFALPLRLPVIWLYLTTMSNGTTANTPTLLLGQCQPLAQRNPSRRLPFLPHTKTVC